MRVAPAATAFSLSLALLLGGLFRTPTAEELAPVVIEADQAVYLRICSTCHPAYDARLRLKSDWRAVVGAMHQRMNDREIHFAKDELEAAIRYLEAHGR